MGILIEKKKTVEVGPPINVILPKPVHTVLNDLSTYSGQSKSELAVESVVDLLKSQMLRNEEFVTEFRTSVEALRAFLKQRENGSKTKGDTSTK